MRLGGMFVNGGLSPITVAVGVLGVVVPAILAWFVQPLVSARAHRRAVVESEAFFWGVGKGGYVAWGCGRVVVVCSRCRELLAIQQYCCSGAGVGVGVYRLFIVVIVWPTVVSRFISRVVVVYGVASCCGVHCGPLLKLLAYYFGVRVSWRASLRDSLRDSLRAHGTVCGAVRCSAVRQ